MKNQLQEIKAVFVDLIENHPPDDWNSELDRVCGENAKLRIEVEKLLKAHAEEDSFLDDGPSPTILGKTVVAPPGSEKPGDKIGPFKLLEQIGEGGMGVVYMAEQTEPVKRRVALKIIKPGMDTKQVVARFEAERQALALMDHQNIARVLDAGATETGRPYFVMELVRGIAITDYCDKEKLTTTERLKLFVTVCKAVQHAHQKGIIHRDIKPSNVLVTLHDGVPVPKVIDFGIAKAINQKLTEKTLFTNFEAMIGTPLYMSPEQAEMSGLDIDTRSDIYSLGVLLYELLTGSTPFDREKLKQAGYDEIRRIIREDEPPTPSTRISSLGEKLSTVSQQRGIDPRRLSHTVRGDLDWIVMKAMEKNRVRRYETASAFVDDVNRYLSDEPIEARPPSMAYRLQKYARRNRTTLSTAIVVAISLLVGTVVSIWQAVDADEARQLAEQRYHSEKAARISAIQQKDRADANFKLAADSIDRFLTGVLRGNWKKNVQTYLLQRELLPTAATFYDQLLATDPDHAQIQYRRGIVYYELALRQERKSGILGAQELENLQKASESFYEVLKRQPNNRHVRLIRERILSNLGLEGDIVSGLNTAIEANPNDWRLINDRALLHRNHRRFDLALADYSRCVDLKPRSVGMHRRRAQLLALMKQFDSAIQNMTRELAIAHDLYGDSHPLVANAHYNRGKIHQSAGNYAAAMKDFNAGIELNSKEVPSRISRQNATLLYLSRANAFRDSAQYEKALWDYMNVLQVSPRTPIAYSERGKLYVMQGSGQKASTEFTKALAMTNVSGKAYTELVRWQPGETFSPVNSTYSWFFSTFPDLRFRDTKQAIELAESAIKYSPNNANAWRCYAVARLRSSDWETTIAALEKTIELNEEGTSYELFFRAMADWQLGNKEKAREWYDKSVTWMQTHKLKQYESEELQRFQAEAAELLGITVSAMKPTTYKKQTPLIALRPKSLTSKKGKSNLKNKME